MRLNTIICWLTLCAFQTACLQADQPPNVVIIYTDDQGYGDLGCYGTKDIQTPNLDRMAKEGVRFTDFYVAQAVCSASRAALLTGCYPNRIGILGALGPASKNGISNQEKTIADVLHEKGYATAIYGKWHLGYQPQFLPNKHGFDDYFGLPYSNDMWPKHPTSKFPDLPLIEGDKTVAMNPDQSQLTTWYTEHAVKFIEANKSKPFFLYVPHNMPHVPLHVSSKFKGKSARGIYGDVIMEIDWSVGEILAALKKHGLDNKTLVIFASDNGPWLSYGDHGGSQGALREGKGTSWEGGVRVPCIMRWPGRIPANTVCREPAMTIDLLPTIAKLTDAKLPAHKIDGLDIWPLMSGQPGAKSPHEALYFYWDRHLQAVRSGKWKLHFEHNYRTMAGKAGGTNGNPAPYSQAVIKEALYDLESDPGETTNVADQHPDVVQRLQKLASQARADLGDSVTRQEGNGVRQPGRVADAPSPPPGKTALSYHVQLDTVMEHDDGTFLWYHPRAAACSKNQVVMTLQKHLRVSDYYSGLYVMESNDLGKTWSQPELKPTLDWRKSGNVTVAVADVTPGWHAKTRKLIAVGAQVRYSPKGKQLEDEPRSNQTAYAVFDPASKAWSEWKLLPVPHESRFNFARSACSQWLTQKDGTVLLPLYFGNNAKEPYSATVAAYAFDGQALKYLKHGNELTLPEVRGLCEPSIVAFQGKYYLTLRNDLKGYVCVSDDGLNYTPIQPWIFDDGTELGSYNTQQHWLSHSDGLFLVYTRRGANNDHIIRHRAPLFMAEVDPKTLRVKRSTEQVLIPERGGEMGNFGASAISSHESWVTVSEGIWNDDARKRGAKGATFIARIQWSKPNQDVK